MRPPQSLPVAPKNLSRTKRNSFSLNSSTQQDSTLCTVHSTQLSLQLSAAKSLHGPNHSILYHNFQSLPTTSVHTTIFNNSSTGSETKMSYNNTCNPQSASSSADNFANAPEPFMAQYSPRASIPQVRSLKDSLGDLEAYFRSSDSGSDLEWLLQEPVRWAAPRSNPPEPALQDTQLSEHDNAHTYRRNQYTRETQVLATHAPQMAEKVQQNIPPVAQPQARGIVIQNFVHDNGRTHLHPQNQSSFEHRPSMQPNDPSYAASHGFPQHTGLQPEQHFGAQNAVQTNPVMHTNLQVIPSSPPAGANHDRIGQFLEFQLPNHTPPAAHINMSQIQSMSSFKIEKINKNHPQDQMARPQPPQHMDSSQPVYQMISSRPVNQHTGSVQPAQPMTSSPRGEDGVPSQHAQYTLPLQDARIMAPSQFEQHVNVSRVGVSSSQITVAPNTVSVKRKAWPDPEDDMPTAKKTMTSAPQAGVLPPEQSQPKKAAKKATKEKYAAIAHSMNDVLPDYSQVALSFSSRDAAAAAAAQKLANKLANEFHSAHEDASIPQTADERLEIVRTLFGAMKDVSRAKDIESEGVTSRWGPKASKSYDDVDIDTTCWEIVTLAERLHREGPSVLSIRDPNYVVHIKNCAKLTFDQRMRVITTLAYQWKARCDGLIKGDTIQTVVAAPLEALQSAVNNWAANAKRAKLYKFAKAHEDGPKETAAKSRKGKKNGPTDSTPQAGEADFPQQAKFDSSGDAGYSIVNESLQPADDAGLLKQVDSTPSRDASCSGFQEPRRPGAEAPPSHAENLGSLDDVGSFQTNEPFEPVESAVPSPRDLSSSAGHLDRSRLYVNEPTWQIDEGRPSYQNHHNPPVDVDFSGFSMNEPVQSAHEAGLPRQANSFSRDGSGAFGMNEPPHPVNKAGPSRGGFLDDVRQPGIEEHLEPLSMTGTPLQGYSDLGFDEDFL
jgi:hypothetical protein